MLDELDKIKTLCEDLEFFKPLLQDTYQECVILCSNYTQ